MVLTIVLRSHEPHVSIIVFSKFYDIGWDALILYIFVLAIKVNKLQGYLYYISSLKNDARK